MSAQELVGLGLSIAAGVAVAYDHPIASGFIAFCAGITACGKW